MSHVRSGSFTDESGLAYLWTTKEVNGKDVPVHLLGGPYPSDEHADAMSKAVSEAVGEGTVADYKKWLSDNNDLFKMDTSMRGLLDAPYSSINEEMIERLRNQGLSDYIVESGLKNTDINIKTQEEHDDLFSNELPPDWVNWPDWKLRKYRKQGYFVGPPAGTRGYLGAYFPPYKDYDRDDHNNTPYNRPAISLPTPERLENMRAGASMDNLIQHEAKHPGLHNVARRLQLAPIDPRSPVDAPDIGEIAGLLPGFNPNPHEGYWMEPGDDPNEPWFMRPDKNWGPSFFNNPKYTTIDNLWGNEPGTDNRAITINRIYGAPGEWAHGLIYDSNEVDEPGDTTSSAKHKRDYQNILNLIGKWGWGSIWDSPRKKKRAN